MATKANDERALKIKELVQEMKLYNNPEELEAVKKELKKNVPFTMRGYLLAYLFITSKHNIPVTTAKKPVAPRPETKDATSFYINVGKASRSSAHELAKFICETAKIDDSDIVSIAYKQNYSFVYIKNNKADGIIDKVNGASYKGRKVKINFSKESNEN